jgi:hypothetical protein
MYTRLAPTPVRVAQLAAPVSNGSAFATVLRLAGGVLTAAAVAGAVGYIWGFRLSILPPQTAAPSEQTGVPAPPAGQPAAAPSGRSAAAIEAPVTPAPVEHPDAVSPVQAPPPAPPENSERELSPQDRQHALAFLKKGEDMFAAGNVGAARLFYERAADAGLAEGALALAATFDPEELARRQVLGGVQPDPAAAQHWYERARQLGASEADIHQ